MFKKRVSIRDDDDDDEIFRGGQTSTKKKSIFWGQPPLRLFFRHLINPSFVRGFIVANENKNKRDFDGERGREREREQRQKAFGGRAKTTPLLHSFLTRKSNLISNR